MKFIITKYVTLHELKEAPLSQSVFKSHSANECGVDKQFYSSREEAEPDLAKLTEFNPTVDYGIVELSE